MSLSQDERQIIQELKSQGYSLGEIRGFLASNRLGTSSRVSEKLTEPQQNAGYSLKETAQDAGNIFTNFGERTYQAGSAIANDITSGKPLSAVSNFIAGIGRSVGGAFVDTAKLALPQSGEDAIASATAQVGTAVAQSRPGQAISDGYNSLSPDTQGNVDTALRFAEGGSELIGVGAAGRATRATAHTANSSVRKLDDAMQTFSSSGVTTSGREGISESFNLGINPESLMQRVARVSKGKQTKFEERAGQSVGSYLVDRDIFGTPDQVADQLVERVRTYKNRVDRNLSQVDGSYKAPAIKTALDDLQEIDTKVSTQGAKGPDSDRIAELIKKHETTGLSLSEVNEVKRLYERNVRLNYLNPASPKPEKLTRANNIDSALRDFVEQKAAAGGFKNVKQLNRETSLAKQLADDLGAEYAGMQGNNAISLTDWILLAEAANSPTAAAGFIGKKVFGSQRVMSATARALAKNKGVNANIPAERAEPALNGYLQFLQQNNLAPLKETK